ncbi:MAG: radical SAM protein [Comamonadaceae bacterium]|nr:radical SAM protein [Comamonadaceae bacterium]
MLSFGTAGCNLACKFCQNWDISQVARDGHADGRRLARDDRPRARQRHGCTSVAFTYNDPVIFAEYAMDTARRLPRTAASSTVAVTAGYMHDAPRREFYAEMDAANVDLKAFTDDFYVKLCGARPAAGARHARLSEARDRRAGSRSPRC